MSGVVKGVKKVFKKVVKTAKKVAVPALIVGAGVLAFSALGGASLFSAGGLSSMMNSLGSTQLGQIMTGAVTNAAMGAGIGGLTAELSGGDFKDGALAGAAAGGVFGGVQGAFAPTTAPAATTGVNAGGSMGPAASVPSGPVGPGFTATGQTASLSPVTNGGFDPSSLAVNAANAGGSNGFSVTGAFGKDGFFQSNGFGHLAGGLGKGLLASAAADDAAEAENKLIEQRRANYGAGNGGPMGGLMLAGSLGPNQTYNATPTDRFGNVYAETRDTGGFVYDPNLKRHVYVRPTVA